MFSYLRYFFGTSVVIVLGAALLLGWYYRIAADNIIITKAQQNNAALVSGFKNTVWKDNGETVKLFYEMPANERVQYQEFNDFSNLTTDFLQGIPIVKFNIYTPDGKKLFSANQEGMLNTDDKNHEITGYEDSDLNPLDVARKGEATSEIIKSATFQKVGGKAKKGVLVRSLIPLTAYNSIAQIVEPSGQAPRKLDAVVEVFLDVTEDSSTLGSFQYLGAGLIIAIFAVLYMTLVFTTRRAERIIEKQHETNVELAAAKSAAESDNQQKSQFLANISHELRTPLNAIIGFSEIIKDEVMGELQNEQYKNYIKDIHSSGVHLLSLINDILDYSKAEAGKLDIEYEDIDLTKLITSSLRLQEPRAKSAEVQLLSEMPEEHIVIRSDAKRLKQVLLNLLSNAVKFTPTGGSVKISAWRNLHEENSISIEVKDTGIGIAPKDLAKALAPFGQVDSELSRRYEGTGLGLPLTKKFVELLGGHLKIESEVNIGTTITVNMPIRGDVASNANPLPHGA